MRSIIIQLGLVSILTLSAQAQRPDLVRPDSSSAEWVAVSGTAIHYFTTAVVHSTVPTETGMIQRSTETVELFGDLSGRLLYHPTSVFDFQAQTLVNTGHQVFSGTVLDSDPVLLHDDEFRFDVDLATGATVGTAVLVDRLAGPRARCYLTIIGTGVTPEGDALADYEGNCRVTPGRNDG